MFHADIKMNIQTFPLLASTVIHEATLGPGECMFIPAWWWVQSQTVSKDHAMVLDIDFDSHSAMYGIFN